MKKSLLSLAALLIAGSAVAQVNFTFNRTSKTEAEVFVAKDGERTTGITATVAISGASEYKVQANNNDGAAGALNTLTSVLCIARNTNAATEADPNKYTLTITNNSENPIQFSKVVLKNGGFNNSAQWQGVNVLNSIRNFKIGYDGSEGDAVEKYVCHNSAAQGDYTGVYRYNSFDAPKTQIINAGETYTLSISVYSVPNSAGMFYGLAEVSLVEPYTLTVGEAGYATLMLGYNAQIPSGVKCYKANVDGTRAVLTEITSDVVGGLDANTAVLVEAENNAVGYTFEPYEDGNRQIHPSHEVNTNEGNELRGTLSAKDITPEADTVCYVLAKPEKLEIGFYRADLSEEGSFLNNANKAYLPVVGSSSSARISFDFGTETAIESVESVENSAVVYDLAGRRVQGAQKGIFIVNGKKVIK